MQEYARCVGPGWKMEGAPERNQSLSAMGWLLLGLGIGATVALLLAPSTGRELRSALASGYRRTIHGVSRGTQQLRRHGSNLLSFTRRRSS
jgi:gas vesicle protein